MRIHHAYLSRLRIMHAAVSNKALSVSVQENPKPSSYRRKVRLTSGVTTEYHSPTVLKNVSSPLSMGPSGPQMVS